MLYFISSDARRNKNNINICESNILSLKDKINQLEEKMNQIGSPDNHLENMLHQFSNNQFLNSEDLISPLGNQNESDDEDEDDNDDADEDDDADDADDDDDNTNNNVIVNEEEDSDEEDNKIEENTNVKEDISTDVKEDVKENVVEEIKEEKSFSFVKEDDELKEYIKKTKVPSSGRKGVYPRISLTKLKEGDIELGPDEKTQFMVHVNKLGRKLWKKL